MTRGNIIEYVKNLQEAGIRISVKNNDLDIKAPKGIITQEIVDELKKRKSEIINYLTGMSFEKNNIEPLENLTANYPISDAQRRLWVLSQFGQGSSAYNMPATISLEKSLDVESFKKAIDSVIERHEILRTVFKEDESGEIKQWILNKEDLNFKIDYKDYTKEANQEEKVNAYIQEDSYKPFDLEKGPLLRAALLQTQDKEYIFYYNLHHIISDGWSMEVLKKDVFSYYESYKEKKIPKLKALKIQYKDYSAWQLSQRNGDSFKAHKDFWLKSLSGKLPLLDLPGCKTRPRIKTYTGQALSTYIDSSTTGKLKNYSHANGGSLFMSLLAGWTVLMYRYTSQTDVIIGTPVAGRDHADLEDQIGFYINTLALRNQVNPEESFNTFYKTLKENTLKSYSHQTYPFDRLVEELDLHRDTSRSAVFDVMLTLQNIAETKTKTKTLQLKKEEESQFTDLGSGISKFDLDISVQEIDHYLSLQVTYNPEVYERELIEGLLKHYKQLLNALLEKPEEKLAHINYLSQKEEHELLFSFNNTKVEYPKDKTITELFEEQVKKTPLNIAVVFEQKTLSYKELDEVSNQLAHYLQKKYKIQTDDLVGIKQERSQWIIISILAVLKSGGAYVPLDPDYPQDRIAHIEKDAACKVCIDENELIKFKENQKKYEKKKPTVLTKSNNLAYVIYTSGSSGKPKGVMIEHVALVNLCFWHQTRFSVTEKDRASLYAGLAFDASVWELFPYLLCGACLYTVPQKIRLDIKELNAYYEANNITISFLPTPIAEQFMEVENKSLRYLLTGGEKLNDFKNKNYRLVNNYGPTESTVVVTSYEVNDRDLNIPIGNPINNTWIYILDESEQLQPRGIIGEICIGGAGLARGYLNQAHLTEEKFVKDPFKHGERMYKTGDLGRWTSDGNIEFFGRKDDQVKIRGYRIELGEIEQALLQHEHIQQVVVLANTNQVNEKELVAYITGTEAHTTYQLRNYLKNILPDYMLPAYFIQMEALPLNANGKTDRKSLPEPEGLGLSSGVAYAQPRNEVEKKLLEIWQDVLAKQNQEIGIDEGFFSVGGNSIKLITLKSKIERAFKISCQVTSLFQYSTIRLQAEMLLLSGESEITTQEELSKLSSALRAGSREDACTDIAVIGMSIKAPGAKNINEFWENLRNGIESITHFTAEELQSHGIPESDNYVKANSYLNDKECFDSNFFGYLPDEAKLMDPQTRVFHEIVWSALEDSGHDPLSYKGLIGLYAGAGSNIEWEAYSYLTNAGKIDGFAAGNLSNKEFANTLIAHKLNLKGPVNSIYTACSTSLVAIHQAVISLLTGENHIAIAGGVSINSKLKSEGYIYQESMIHSKDGHNRTFDADSSGTVAGEGAGAVVLKKLSRAIQDGDQIYAVIKGSAINNDGNRKVGFTAPSVEGQSEVIRLAHQAANISSHSITYLEAHGTATKLGDPIEVLALTRAFGTIADPSSEQSKQYCALGSVKTNIGHLDTAAGVAGFIKTVLCLKHKELVPSLHFKSSNPEINFTESPFYVNTELKTWPKQEGPRRAGVSSFGIGGTNAHVILEEAPAQPEELAVNLKTVSSELITLSAKTSMALSRQHENLKHYLIHNKHANLADVAWTLQNRRSFLYKTSFVAQTVAQAIQCLEKAENIQSQKTIHPNEEKKIIFMFPGQGSQYENMGIGLYSDEQSIFRETLDECFKIAQQFSHVDYKNILYPGKLNNPVHTINQTINTQPILFMFEYALAKQMAYYGIMPDVMIGHSIGEYVAACFGGVLTLSDALKMVIKRAELMQALPGGAMLAVGLPADKIKNYLSAGVNIAAVNTPASCVISGDTGLIEKLSKQLEKEGIPAKLLHTSHAFHSAMMDPILDEFTKSIDNAFIQPLQIPYISNITGQQITEEELKQNTYWSAHIRETVKFSQGISQILSKQTNTIFIEIGPGHSLSTFVRQHVQENKPVKTCTTIPQPKASIEDASEFLLNQLSELWKSGLEINWAHLQHKKTKHKITLPTYPFEKIKYPMGRGTLRTISEQLRRLNNEQLPDELQQFGMYSNTNLFDDDTKVSIDPIFIQNERSNMSTIYSEPQTETEKDLCVLFQLFFGVAEIGIDDNFFELGGDSLKAMTLISRIHQKFNVQIGMKEMLEHSDIRNLGKEIDSLKNISKMQDERTKMNFENKIEL